MTNSILIIVLASVATILTRLAVLVLPNRLKKSVYLEYLSQVLPVASFGLLVVYSIKNIAITSFPFGLPELISIVVITILQLWKNNLLLSIFTGSLTYIILVNFIFL